MPQRDHSTHLQSNFMWTVDWKLKTGKIEQVISSKFLNIINVLVRMLMKLQSQRFGESWFQLRWLQLWFPLPLLTCLPWLIWINLRQKLGENLGLDRLLNLALQTSSQFLLSFLVFFKCFFIFFVVAFWAGKLFMLMKISGNFPFLWRLKHNCYSTRLTQLWA